MEFAIRSLHGFRTLRAQLNTKGVYYAGLAVLEMELFAQYNKIVFSSNWR
jgi:hypothetical protein